MFYAVFFCTDNSCNMEVSNDSWINKQRKTITTTRLIGCYLIKTVDDC